MNIAGEQAKWLTDGTADWFWPAAEKAGIPIMFLTTGQLPLFGAIAERHPQLILIIDHMGVSSEAMKNNMMPATIAEVGRARQISERVGEAVVDPAVLVASPIRSAT